MNKKVVAITLALCISLGGCKIYEGQAAQNFGRSTVLTDSEEKKVVKDLRKEFKIDDSYELISSEYDSFDYNSSIKFMFESSEELLSLDYSVKKGSVTGMSISKRNEGRVVRYTKEQLKENAEKILNERFPDIKNNLKEVSEETTFGSYSTKNSDYLFRYIRTIDGEEFPENNLELYISGVTGEMSSYRINWDDVKYKKKSSITLEEAEKIFLKERDVEAEYKSINLSTDHTKPDFKMLPVYIAQHSAPRTIDANTKKFLGNSGNSYNDNDSLHYFYRATNPVEDMKTPISKETAVKTVKELGKKLGLDLRYDNITTTLKKDFADDTLFWDVSIDTFHGEVDSKSGKIMGASAYLGYDDFNQLTQLKREYSLGYITKDIFNMRAKELLEYGGITQEEYDNRFEKDQNEVEKSHLKSELKKYFKDIIGIDADLLIKESQNNSQIVVTGFRKENDVPYYENGISLTYDTDTKSIVDLHIIWNHNLKFESPGKKISKDEAGKKLLAETGITRKLVRKPNTKTGERSDELLLVYELGYDEITRISLDGKTLYTESGIYQKPEMTTHLEDIDASPYKNEILMLDKTIYLGTSDSKFNPKNEITKSEALKWMVRLLTRGNYSSILLTSSNYFGNNSGFLDVKRGDDDFYTLITAVQLDILEEGGNFNGSAKVTMDEILKWLINGMGDKKLAQSKELFGDDGYTKLGKFHNIITDDTDLSGTISKEKTAKLLYDFIVKIENDKN